MKIIRQGVFETNSSSTHSICIAKENDYELPDKVFFEFGDFCWQVDKLDTTQEKANYLYTGIVHHYGYEDKEYMQEAIQTLFDWLGEDGIDCEFEEIKKDIWDCGSFDHTEDLPEFIRAVIGNKKRLYRYLFSDKSFVLTGNDNDYLDVDIKVDYKHEEYYKGN